MNFVQQKSHVHRMYRGEERGADVADGPVWEGGTSTESFATSWAGLLRGHGEVNLLLLYHI